MTILFIIGIILIRNLVGRAYTQVFSNNCSQTYFDEATLNYMASFKFMSENIDMSCPNAKAIAFRKTDLLEIEMELRIVEEIWKILNKTERLRLKYELRHRLHFSCNSISLTKELCRSEYALDGGVFISIYDGSLANHLFQKSCSICFLKTSSARIDEEVDSHWSPILTRVNLSLIDIVDWRELQSDDIMSVKFIRSRTDRRQNRDNLLGSLSGTSTMFPYHFMLLSDSVTYNIQVRLLAAGSHIIFRKGQNNSSKECLFRCDWSSTCLSHAQSICDNRVDCRHGDDENTLICQLYDRLNQNNKKNSSVRKLFSNNAIHNKIHKYEDNLKFIIPVTLSVIVLVIAAMGIVIFYFYNKRRHIANQKKYNISNVNFSKIHNNTMYIPKLSLEDLIKSPSINELTGQCDQDDRIMSRWCAASIHQSMAERNNNIGRQFIHPKSFRKPDRSLKMPSDQYSGLCEQINYPDIKTRSNWLRTYLQLCRSDRTCHQNNPPVLNISQFPPVSFRCKQ